jgi:drug/metabolite transporter (DMT)-like permease
MKRSILAFLAVSLIWGSTYLAIRVAIEAYPPFLLGGLRFLAAGAVMYAAARLRGEAAPTRVEWGSALLTGTLFFVLGNGLVNVAERSVSSGLAAVLVSTMPLWMTVLGRLFGEPATRREIAGVGLGLAGVAVMNAGASLQASATGLVCAVVAPVAWAAGSLASKRLPLPEGTVMRTGAQMLAGGAVMMLVAAATGEPIPQVHPPRAILAVVYLCVFGSLVGFTAYAYLLRHTSAVVATSYAYINPAIAVALGVAFAGERLDLATAAGAAIVLAAVAIVVAGRRAVRAPEPPVASVAQAPDAPGPAQDQARLAARST